MNKLKKIEEQSGAAFILKRGQRLRVVDRFGQQVSDLFCFNKDDARERLSAGRSIDYAERLYLSTGDLLYSNRSRPMLKIVEDSCGRHDLLMTPCSLEMFKIVSGNDHYHPSCDENLVSALSSFGLGGDEIGTTFNIFMNVEVDAQGKIVIKDPLSRPGDTVVMEAEMDLIVGLTACSHKETNAGKCKPIWYCIEEVAGTRL